MATFGLQMTLPKLGKGCKLDVECVPARSRVIARVSLNDLITELCGPQVDTKCTFGLAYGGIRFVKGTQPAHPNSSSIGP